MLDKETVHQQHRTGAMIHVLQLPLHSRTPGGSVMPPKSGRGLLKESGKPPGCRLTGGPGRLRQQPPGLAALSMFAQRSQAAQTCLLRRASLHSQVLPEEENLHVSISLLPSCSARKVALGEPTPINCLWKVHAGDRGEAGMARLASGGRADSELPLAVRTPSSTPSRGS